MKNNAKLWIFVATVVIVLVLNHVFGWSDALFGGNAIASLKDSVNSHPVQAALAYVVLSVVGSVVLALPGVLFALVAGTVFGAIGGTLLCWLSVTAGACISFIVGRYFLKDAVKPKLEKSVALNRLLSEGAGRSDVYLLAITRLVPIFPYNLQNFAYGITDIRFAPYAIYSALFMLPGTAVYTVASAGLVDSDNRLACFALAAALLVITLVIAYVLKKKAALA